MIALVLGAPDSGKSRIAEELALQYAGNGRRIYVATMIPFGDAGRERVERHRKLREGKGFETIERPDDLVGLSEEIVGLSEAVCLLECASNLVGNEMHAERNAGATDAALATQIAESIAELGARAKALVVVSNEFTPNLPDYDDETRRYVALQRMVNESLRALADVTYEFKEGDWRVHENV